MNHNHLLYTRMDKGLFAFNFKISHHIKANIKLEYLDMFIKCHVESSKKQVFSEACSLLNQN